MDVRLIKKAEEAGQDVLRAKGWLNLLACRHWGGGRFALSSAHGSIRLTICGQVNPGNKNYHESPLCLGQAIGRIIEKDTSVIEQAIEALELQAKEANAAAKEQLQEALSNIEKAGKQ